MKFNDWWELNAEYCIGSPARLIALRAWLAIKAYHRIPFSDLNLNDEKSAEDEKSIAEKLHIETEKIQW